MRIAEIFRSFQGEGRLTGVESVFVRASGCNLRCGYCDTPYASWTPEGEELSVAEILERMERLAVGCVPDAPSGTDLFSGEKTHSANNMSDENMDQSPSGTTPVRRGRTLRHAVLTGGEPMLFDEIIALTETLRKKGWHITIETSGTIDLAVTCDLMSISPKLSNSAPSPEQGTRWIEYHEERRHAPTVVQRLLADYDYQLKFVVDRIEDCREVELYLADLPKVERSRVMLMPQGVEPVALAVKAEWLANYCEAQGFAFCPRRQIEWFGNVRGR